MSLGHSYPLTHAGIAVNAPRESGVFAVSTSDRCLYVGETHNIQRRLLDYVNEVGETAGVLSFQFEIAKPEFRQIRQRAVIRELRPTDNPQFA